MAELNGVTIESSGIRALALTNYGHFTSMQVNNGRVLGLSLHLKRLLHDCREVFDTELDLDRVRHFLRHALAEASRTAVVRVTIFDPALDVRHPGKDAQPQVLVTTRPVPPNPPQAIRLRTVTYEREMPEVKHVGLFAALRHRRAAQRDGFDDVLFANADSVVSEAATSNIGFIDGDRIIWPRSRYLTGVTMRLVNQACQENPVTEPMTVAGLPNVEAVFATNAATGIQPIHSVNNIHWPRQHPLLHTIRDQYQTLPLELI